MRFQLTIDCDNAAFADDETGEVDAYSASRELARILRAAADEVAGGRLLDARVDDPSMTGRWVRDENGNKVGSYELIEV